MKLLLELSLFRLDLPVTTPSRVGSGGLKWGIQFVDIYER